MRLREKKATIQFHVKPAELGFKDYYKTIRPGSRPLGLTLYDEFYGEMYKHVSDIVKGEFPKVDSASIEYDNGLITVTLVIPSDKMGRILRTVIRPMGIQTEDRSGRITEPHRTSAIEKAKAKITEEFPEAVDFEIIEMHVGGYSPVIGYLYVMTIKFNTPVDIKEIVEE